jgi:hypothetical protein
VNQSSSVSIFSDPAASNTTQEFAIRLQNDANYDRETLFKHRPANKPPPASTLDAKLQALFPPKAKQPKKKKKAKKHNKQTAEKKKTHNISNDEWKKINDANKKLLTETKAWKKNQDFLKEHDSPLCIICKEQRPEDPAHLFSACPVTQNLAAKACDAVIQQKLDSARASSRRHVSHKHVPIPPIQPFWHNHAALSPSDLRLPLWLAKGATPVCFDAENAHLGFTDHSCAQLAALLSRLMIERSLFIYDCRNALLKRALRERQPPDPPPVPP